MLVIIGSLILILVVTTWLMRKISVGNYDKKYVFITGCDSGFGKLLANKLDKMGLHVFAGCLTEKGSKEIKYTCSAKLETIAIDVTSESSIKKAVKEVQRRLPKDKGKYIEKISLHYTVLLLLLHAFYSETSHAKFLSL